MLFLFHQILSTVFMLKNLKLRKLKNHIQQFCSLWNFPYIYVRLDVQFQAKEWWLVSHFSFLGFQMEKKQSEAAYFDTQSEFNCLQCRVAENHSVGKAGFTLFSPGITPSRVWDWAYPPSGMTAFAGPDNVLSIVMLLPKH